VNRSHRFSFSTAMPATNDRGDQRPNQVEAAARAAFELSAGRKFPDAEWATDRARLLEFIGILRAWEPTATCQRGNVEKICQLEH
jgi:hypothetical protein